MLFLYVSIKMFLKEDCDKEQLNHCALCVTYYAYIKLQLQRSW